MKPTYTPSGQSRVYRVTQLRTDGVHCRESAGTGPVNLKVVPNECCLGRSPWTNQYAPLFLYTYIRLIAMQENQSKRTKNTMSLDYSSVCNIGSRIGWVSMKKMYDQIVSHGCRAVHILTSSHGVEFKLK